MFKTFTFVGMDQLQAAIKQLLEVHDCVIVPGFGAFVMRRVGARYNDEKQVFKAPNKEISFNKLLKDDDGLLINEVMRLRNCEYDVARNFVSDQVGEANLMLEEGHTVHIKGIGKLKIHIRGVIHFTPVADVNFRNDMYGMFDLYIAPVQKSRKIVNKTTQQSMVRRVAAAAVIVFVLFFYSQPLRESLNVEEAGLIPVEVLVESTESLSNTEVIVSPTPKSTIEESIQEDIAEISEISALNNETFDLNIAEVSKPDTLYHVIIGSVTSIEMATKAMARFKVKNIESTMLDCGNRYRISHKSFENKAEAIKFWKSFRETSPQFSDSWIYLEKPNS